MKHLIICREYPPAPSGGIGTYAFHISRLLAEAGETVHVIGQMWERAEARVEERCNGRLIIHRVPYEDWASLLPRKPHPGLDRKEATGLFKSSFPPQAFSWRASLLAEELIEREGIDIIEAQDYEAPLYYFQLRRALGKGPKRRPPCFVHLHSPTEFIARYNDWDISLPNVATAIRLEDYSISAADALLCPSRYLARQAEDHYGLDGIQVIPLPLGDNPWFERSEDTWENGTVCYLGRLERRKGVVEWIDAAVQTASDYPAARFEFIGWNVLGTGAVSSEEFLRRLIPRGLRGRFLFRGEQKRSSVPALLSSARMAVVPSRWENFPNTCVEAMCSGLPVIATRNGGMAEMIEDGRTGWLAGEADSGALSHALKRALDTPPTRVAEMGRLASADIRRMCDNDRIVESHLDFRNRLVEHGAGRSLRLPLNLPRSSVGETKRRSARQSSSGGLGVVITCRDRGTSLDGCLLSLERQARKPAAVAIVWPGPVETTAALARARGLGWQIIHSVNMDATGSKNAGIQAIMASGTSPLGFVFLDDSDRLEPDFIAECESALRHCEEVGVVSCWISNVGPEGNERMHVAPCPAFPYQWAVNEAVGFSAVRAEALEEAGNFRAFMQDGYEKWDLFNAAMAAGWAAVTIPSLLGKSKQGPALRSPHDHAPGRMRKSLLARFPELVARDAADIVMLAESHALHSSRGDGFGQRAHALMARAAMASPRETTLLVLNKMRKSAYRMAMRMVSLFYSNG